MIYADTSVTASLFLGDSNYDLAVSLLAKGEPFIWTPWQKLEFGNAIRSLVARKALSREEFEALEDWLCEYVEKERFILTPLESNKLWSEAERISKAHTANAGVRTLDLLHVAAARVTGCSDFATFDVRQTALAKAEGLKIRP